MANTSGGLREHSEGKLKEDLHTPSMYKVIILNDDYTTMDFVIHVLENIFHKSLPEATRLMLQIHKSGAGLGGVYTKDIAETKVLAVHELASQNEFPLKCVMEEE